MGYSHSTYMGYGVLVDVSQYKGDSPHAWHEGQRLDPILRDPRTAAVGHLSAGGYDNDHLFLIASDPDDTLEVNLGSFMIVHPHTKAMKLPDWDEQLTRAWVAAGYDPKAMPEPGWIVVPDLS